MIDESGNFVIHITIFNNVLVRCIHLDKTWDRSWLTYETAATISYLLCLHNRGVGGVCGGVGLSEQDRKKGDSGNYKNRDRGKKRQLMKDEEEEMER